FRKGAAFLGARDHQSRARRRPRSPRTIGRRARPTERQMKGPKLPKGAIRPRPAVLSMAPYSPPTGGRAGKLRLDFNENTVGCSPRVIDVLKNGLDAAALAVYPEYDSARETIANYFRDRK